jgi:hypothetical protein
MPTEEVRMAARLRSLLVTLAVPALVGLSHGPASAADRSPVDTATQRVERGAHQIGEGRVLEGAGETAKGIGSTLVEGAKYTGRKLAEAGAAAEPDAKTAWDRTKEGAVAFGASVREFFASLFR